MPPREPIFNAPGVVVGLILAMTAAHLWRGALDPASDVAFVVDWAFIPLRALMDVDPSAVRALAEAAPEPGDDGRFRHAMTNWLTGPMGGGAPVTALSYAFLHGGVTHLVFNALWLLAFGAAAARRFGTARFLALFAAGAIGGALAHFLVDMTDPRPLVGASAAVSACMGAAARFVFQPGAPLGAFWSGTAARYDMPAPPLRDLLRDSRPLIFLIVWAAMNLAVGLAAAPAGLVDASIAWQAHFGGFAVGLLGFRLFDPPRAA